MRAILILFFALLGCNAGEPPPVALGVWLADAGSDAAICTSDNECARYFIEMLGKRCVGGYCDATGSVTDPASAIPGCSTVPMEPGSPCVTALGPAGACAGSPIACVAPGCLPASAPSATGDDCCAGVAVLGDAGWAGDWICQ